MDNNTLVGLRVLQAIGLYVDSTGRIADDDSGELLLYRDTLISTQNATIRHAGETIYDPVGNYRLAEFLLSVLLRKDFIDTGKEVRVVSQVREPNVRIGTRPKIAIQVLYMDNSEILSKFYNNISLCYIDLILKISDAMCEVDLKELDVIEDAV